MATRIKVSAGGLLIMESKPKSSRQGDGKTLQTLRHVSQQKAKALSWSRTRMTIYPYLGILYGSLFFFVMAVLYAIVLVIQYDNRGKS